MNSYSWSMCEKCEAAYKGQWLTHCPTCGTKLKELPPESNTPRKAWPGKPPGMQRPPRGDDQKPI